MGTVRLLGHGTIGRNTVKTPKNGFTLIELMIVIAIIAVIASIAIPNLMSARLNANETSAIATLRSISSAEAQFQASGKCDVNDNGTGEYGLFREMSGAIGVRTDSDAATIGTIMSPAVLSGAFRTFNAGDEVSRSGYLFRMVLAGPGGIGVLEAASGALAAPIDPSLGETIWCCYAWPSAYAKTGNRTFFVNQAGDIVNTDHFAYSGTGRLTATNVGAAFEAGGVGSLISGRVAVGTRGRDGRRWKQVN